MTHISCSKYFLFSFHMQSTDSQIRERGATLLSESLKTNTTITKLNLYCTSKWYTWDEKRVPMSHSLSVSFLSTVADMKDMGVTSVCEALKSNTALTKLNMGCMHSKSFLILSDNFHFTNVQQVTWLLL